MPVKLVITVINLENNRIRILTIRLASWVVVCVADGVDFPTEDFHVIRIVICGEDGLYLTPKTWFARLSRSPSILQYDELFRSLCFWMMNVEEVCSWEEAVDGNEWPRWSSCTAALQSSPRLRFSEVRMRRLSCGVNSSVYLSLQICSKLLEFLLKLAVWGAILQCGCISFVEISVCECRGLASLVTSGLNLSVNVVLSD